VSRTCPECQTQYEDEILHCPEDGLDLSAVDPDDELLGRTVGSYRVSRLLGKGGMGAVYMAEHPVIGSRVAIKFLHPQFATDKKIVDRFFNEARAVNVIGHDNILKILDLNVTDDNRHYFIMEFLHGKPLQDLVLPDGPMPLDVAGPILLQICEALQAAHDSKIIHRDLKPDNVYLTVHKGKKNFVKVVDFGIARVTDESGVSTGKTQTGMVMGTPAYMSPEQAGGMTARIDCRSDIYGLGCMMYQMATGRLPFPGTSFGEVLIGHLQLTPPAPRTLAPAIPEAYEAVIVKCLQKKQEDRYQSMREVHDTIAQVMDDLGISRDLPAATAEELAAVATATKTRTGPGTGVKTPGRPALPRKTPATPARPMMTVATPAPPAPAKSKAGLTLVLTAVALVLAGGIAAFVVQQVRETRKESERVAEHERLRREEKEREEARRAEEERRRLEAQKVQLSVISDPVGAIVEATWAGGAKGSVTPFDVAVPKDASVHFSFSMKEFLPWSTDVVADGPKVVRATLLAEPKPAPPRLPAIKAPGSDKKKPQAEKDDTIPVEF
jgi:tRNA A-37 threonylcarbamoyl transferase component Bud32